MNVSNNQVNFRNFINTDCSNKKAPKCIGRKSISYALDFLLSWTHICHTLVYSVTNEWRMFLQHRVLNIDLTEKYRVVEKFSQNQQFGKQST